MAPSSAPEISSFKIMDWLILGCVGIYFFSIFIFWGYLFYHWGVSSFETSPKKRKWFWVILLGGFLYLLGPLIYYFIVVEKGKGLQGKTREEAETELTA